MILRSGDESPQTVINVHTEKKIKRKRKVVGRLVSIVTEPEDKFNRISFFKRRRLDNHKSARSGINRMGSFGGGVPL